MTQPGAPRHRAVWAAFGVGLGIYAVVLLYFPGYNWDVIFYVACALRPDFADPAALQTETFELIRGAVTAAQFQDLTDPGWPYRHAVHTDPEAFRQQLPFYCSKPAYVGLVRGLYLAGIDVVAATQAVSAVAVAACAAVIAVWLRRTMPFALAIPMAVLCLLFALHRVGLLSSPDGLGCLLTLAAFLAFVDRRPAVAFALLALAIAVRRDHALLVVLLLPYAVLAAPSGWRISWGKGAVLGAACVGVFGILQAATASYPRGLHMFHSFIGNLAHPESAAYRFGFQEYLTVLVRNGGEVLLDKPLVPILLALPAASVAMARRLPSEARLDAELGLVATAYVVLHFLIFPEYGIRFFAAQYAIILVTLAVVADLAAERRWPGWFVRRGRLT